MDDITYILMNKKDKLNNYHNIISHYTACTRVVINVFDDQLVK